MMQKYQISIICLGCQARWYGVESTALPVTINLVAITSEWIGKEQPCKCVNPDVGLHVALIDQAQPPEGEPYSREYDEKWEDWKEGDRIVWEDDKQGQIYFITHINHDAGYVYWNEPLSGEESMTRSTNMLRVTIHGQAPKGE